MASRSFQRRLRRWPSFALAAVSILVLAFLVIPIVIVIPMSLTGSDYLEFPPSSFSLRWYRTYFTDHDWTDPTLLSLRIASLVALTATVTGAMASLAIARSRLSGSNLVAALIAAPMVTPAIITAVAYYLFLSRLNLVGTTLGFVIAHTLMTLPMVIFTVLATLQRIDPRLEVVALSLGASMRMSLWRVTLPLALPGILVGAAFAFITSFDEATVSFFVSTASGKPLPKKLFEGIEWELSPVIAAVSSLLTLISLALVVLLEFGRKFERGKGGKAGDHAVG